MLCPTLAGPPRPPLQGSRLGPPCDPVHSQAGQVLPGIGRRAASKPCPPSWEPELDPERTQSRQVQGPPCVASADCCPVLTGERTIGEQAPQPPLVPQHRRASAAGHGGRPRNLWPLPGAPKGGGRWSPLLSLAAPFSLTTPPDLLASRTTSCRSWPSWHPRTWTRTCSSPTYPGLLSPPKPSRASWPRARLSGTTGLRRPRPRGGHPPKCHSAPFLGGLGEAASRIRATEARFTSP